MVKQVSYDKDIKIKKNKIIKYKSIIGESEMTEELLNYITMIYIFIIFLIMDIFKYLFN
jgi:hypothetical protein